jgi:hypothetical protein
MSAIGRISGPLLKSNLLRNGIDLAFETDLLYLDVNNQRIGIKNATPQYELDITGTTRTTDIRVTNRADIGDINVLGNTIWSDNQYLYLGTVDNIVYNNKLRVDDIDVEGNVISTNTSNSNLELRPNGTGEVHVYSNMEVDGNIHATGNITADGNIVLGDADTDSITFNADVASNIIPDLDNTYNLGYKGTEYTQTAGNFALGDITITISGGTGTLNVPASGTAWADDVVNTTANISDSLLLALQSTSGTLHKVTTTSVWTGSRQASVSAPSILDGTYNVVQVNLGAKRWADVWVDNIVTNGINTGTIVVDGVDLTLRQGNIFYVAENGDDTHTGTHQQDPFASISKALSVSSSGDTIHVYPGIYTELFPLTVPAGVTVKGQGIRGVTVKPTTATRYNDAFLLNGQTTIEDLTVSDFYSGGAFHDTTAASAGSATLNVGTAPFAHAYVSGGTITFGGNDYAISNAVYTHGTGQLVITHAGPDAGVGTTTFIKDIVFSCNGGNRTFPDNGYAFRFATDFEVTSRSPYIKNVSVITKGSVTSSSDPRGFDAGDAGKGVYVDGAYATINSKEAAMLFHSATFITPGVDALTATNGARIEWLNSFTYFANRSLYAFDSNDGLKGEGKTRIRLSGISGTFAGGETITFTSTDNSTVVTKVINSVENSDTLVINGKDTGLLGFDFTPLSISSSGGASATAIESLDLRDFGAEIRMIGSASVYGNNGLVGDGPGVLVYAIGHNLAYIGNGKAVTNDPSTVVQAQEVIETNDAQIRYNSVDHKGDFRVGDLFYVNQETGSASFSVSDFVINTTNGVTFNTGSDTTFVDGSKIETGDWRISGNTIQTLTQDANFNAASGTIKLNDNVDITGNLDVTGNVTIGGNITIGDEATDTIEIIAGIDSDIIPKVNGVYSLGEATKQWSNIWVNQVNIDSIKIRDNFIETTESNADLEIRANGTGNIYIPNNNVQIDNALTVDGLVTLANTNITGTVTHVGTTNQTGTTNVTGNVTVTQNLDVGAAAQFEEILIDDNFITTTTGNTDLEFRTSGSGNIIVPDNNVNITNDLTVAGDISANNLTASANITSATANIGDVQISGTTVEATASNADLELRANGTGDVTVPTSDVIISQALQVSGTTDLQNVNLGGVLTHIGNTVQTGNYTLTSGYFTNSDIRIDGNTIETTASSSNLELRANGSGIISIPTNNVEITLNLDVDGDTDLQTTNITGTLTHLGDTNQTGSYTLTGQADIDSVQIDSNFITTNVSNTDLELRANGTGKVLIPNNNVQIDNNLTVSGDTDLQATNVTGTITHVGNTTQTGNIDLSGNFDITGAVTVSSVAQFENVNITNNVVTTTESNSDLELRAAGTGEVIVPQNDVHITNDLIVDGTITVGDINSAGTITANQFSTGDILIDDNFITTTASNSDLELRASGTGEVVVPSNDVVLSQNLTVDGLATLANTNITGTVTHVGTTNQTGDLNLTGALDVDGDITIAGAVQFENIQIAGNVVETTHTNSDLELRANGTGKVVIPTNDVEVLGNLTVDGTLTVGDIVSTGQIQANTFYTGDIRVDDNFITTTTSNSDLELRASGTGSIVIDTLSINDSTISTTGDLTLTPSTEQVIIDATGSVKLPSGTTAQRPTGVAGQIRFNSQLSRFEGYDGTNWIVLHGVEDLDGDTKVTAEQTTGANDDTIRFDVAGNTIVDITNIRMSAPKVTVDDITIDGNVISTTTTNTDMILGANGTGSVKIDNIAFSDNTITNTSSNAVTLLSNTDNGYFKFGTTYGMVLPGGTAAERPPVTYTEQGMMRYNSADGRVEIWDGSNWVSVAGAQSGVTRAEAEDIALEIVLSLG